MRSSNAFGGNPEHSAYNEPNEDDKKEDFAWRLTRINL